MEVAKQVFTDGHMVEAKDMDLANKISGTISKHYPGHVWAVHVSSEQGVVYIKNFNSSYLHGYMMKYKDVERDTALKCCIMAAGEILERSHMNRGAWRVGEKATKIDGIAKKYQPQVNGRIVL